MVRDIFVSVISGLILLAIADELKKSDAKKNSDSCKNQNEDE